MSPKLFMKIAYFNCSSGISGDMIISCLLNTGVCSAGRLEKILKSGLRIKNWRLKVERTERNDLPCLRTRIIGDMEFSSPKEIRNIIAGSKFNSSIKQKSIRILNTLIEGESRVHNINKNKVHFHEINSIDTLIDIVASVYLVHQIAVEKIVCSKINIGCPAPCALQIAKSKKVPVYSTNSRFELATPTGMAIISNIADEFGELPQMEVGKFGFGTGTLGIPGQSNLLRLIVGNYTPDDFRRKILKSRHGGYLRQ